MPKAGACNPLTTTVVLSKSSSQLTYSICCGKSCVVYKSAFTQPSSNIGIVDVSNKLMGEFGDEYKEKLWYSGQLVFMRSWSSCTSIFFLLFLKLFRSAGQDTIPCNCQTLSGAITWEFSFKWDFSWSSCSFKSGCNFLLGKQTKTWDISMQSWDKSNSGFVLGFSSRQSETILLVLSEDLLPRELVIYFI